MNFKQMMMPIAVAATLLAPVAVKAQMPANFVGGSVTAVDAAKKTVTVQGWGQQPSQTVKVGASTKYDQSVQGAMSDLKVGDKIRVMGRPSEDDDNTIDARAIMLAPPGGFGAGGFGRRGGGGRPGGGGGGGGNRPGGGGGQGGGRGRGGVMGTIATLTPKFTVTTDDKQTKTIDTTDDTRVMVSKSASLADITVGKMVFATTDNGVAKEVHIMPAFGRGGGGGFGGGRRGGGGGGGNN